MTFRIGQKVVCIDDGSRAGHIWGGDLLYRNKIYTVTGFWRCEDGLGLILREAKNHEEFGQSYDARRFRPAVDRPTDISVFTEILRTTKAPERALALTSQHQTGGGK